MRREYDQCRESRTRTFFKLKLLQELKVVEIFGVVFGRSLSPTCDPVWERPCGRWPGDGVPDELVSWGVRNSWYFQTTYTGTVPGLVNFMMGDGDLAKNATGRPCRNAQRFNFPLRRAVFKVQVAERFETFWSRPEQEGGEAWSSHLHGRDALKPNVGSCSQGSRRDGGRVDGRFDQPTADLRHSFRLSTTSKPFIATSLDHTTNTEQPTSRHLLSGARSRGSQSHRTASPRLFQPPPRRHSPLRWASPTCPSPVPLLAPT